MDQILEQVARARRRLWLDRFTGRVLHCLAGAFVVGTVAIAIAKLVPINDAPAALPLWCAGAAVVVGTASALLWTAWDPGNTIEAAIEIDRRFGLQERIASSVQLTPETRRSAVGQALVADAQQAVVRIHVEDRFPLHWEQSRWLPLAAAVVAFALVSQLSDHTAETVAAAPTSEADRTAVATATSALAERLERQEQEAAERGLDQAEELLRDARSAAQQLSDSPEADHPTALAELNNLAGQLERRRTELGSEERLRQQLAQMSTAQDRGDGSAVAAMQRGDWAAASEALEQMRETLSEQQLSEEDRQQIEKQLDQLHESVADTASDLRQQASQLEQQMGRQQNSGSQQSAAEAQRQRDQLAQQRQAAEQSESLASAVNEVQEALSGQSGTSPDESLQALQQQLQQLGNDAQQGQMLDEALNEIQAAKQAMSCEACQGAGCPACNRESSGEGNAERSDRAGKGVGNAAPPEVGASAPEQTETTGPASRVSAEPEGTNAIAAGETGGANTRGQDFATIQKQMHALGDTPSDPQLIERLPRSRREHAEEYFNLLRGQR